MTYTVVALIKRKPGITPEQFRAHYEDTHVPLLKSLVGPTFPLTHTRNYVTRSAQSTTTPAPGPGGGEDPYPPTMYMGQPSEVSYDSVTVMVWADKEAFDKFCEVFYREDVALKMQEDEQVFLDKSFRVVYAVEEPLVTRGDGP